MATAAIAVALPHSASAHQGRSIQSVTTIYRQLKNADAELNHATGRRKADFARRAAQLHSELTAACLKVSDPGELHICAMVPPSGGAGEKPVASAPSRWHDWSPIRDAGDTYSSTSVQRKGQTVSVVVQHRYRHVQRAEAGAYDSERHFVRFDCGQATMVEGHAYLYRRGRYVGVRTFEYDLDSTPIGEADDIYKRLYRQQCRASAKGRS